MKNNLPYEVYSPDYLENQSTDTDEIQKIRDLIRALPLPQQKIWVMYTEFGTYAEVARHLHCSVPTAATYIKQIREKLKDKIKDRI